MNSHRSRWKRFYLFQRRILERDKFASFLIDSESGVTVNERTFIPLPEIIWTVRLFNGILILFFLSMEKWRYPSLVILKL